MSVKRSNFTLVFFKAVFHANQVVKDNEQNQAHIFQGTYFESSQIHQLTIMYCFEHTDHDIHLKFYFKSFQTLFVCV